MKEWKGRFREPLDPHALAFSSSLNVDRRLALDDIEGSLAHAAMLARSGIISRSDAAAIRKALREIRGEVAGGTAGWLEPGASGGRFVAEDIHMAVEQRLIEKAGPAGERLHTARSRNDQVALDVRLFLRRAIDEIRTGIREVQRSLVDRAELFRNVLMPGYTHLQRAQPILLAHHLLAYVDMFERDRDRFLDCRRRVNLSPLGAAALAGTSFPIDRGWVARELKFDGPIANSIDAVSDRDVHIEFIAAAAVTMMHVSRIAEELVLWSSEEWHFARIGDGFSTGSSIMPQKRNPDMAELLRGKTGRVYGSLMTLLTVMKGLPLAYNRDLQEDKEPLFDAADTVESSLDILGRTLGATIFESDRFEKELDAGFLLATEAADYLVRKGIPFRQAHAIVSDIVARCEDLGCTLAALPLAEFTSRSEAFGKDIFAVLNARRSIGLKRSVGSTSPAEVANALRLWRKRLKEKDSERRRG
jgi:argininosuccinate lyase